MKVNSHPRLQILQSKDKNPIALLQGCYFSTMALQDLGGPTFIFLLCVCSVLSLAGYSFLKPLLFRRIHPNAPPLVQDNSLIVGAHGFWGKRWSWFKQSSDASQTGSFSFHAGGHFVVGVSGDKAREWFFNSRELDFNQGYAALFRQGPNVEAFDDAAGRVHDDSRDFYKRLAFLLKSEQLRRRLPFLISDAQEAMEELRNEPSGLTDPFESIHRMVFRLTLRVVGAKEIADDRKMLEDLIRYYSIIDDCTTPAYVLFPNLPSPAKIKHVYTSKRLHVMLRTIIENRMASSEKHDDPLQHYIDEGDRPHKIISFLLGAFVAGTVNSGVNAAWVLCFLACSPEWVSKIYQEICDTAAKYTRNPSAPLRKQLCDIPLEAWESEFPTVDICLRDSLRLNLAGTAFRKNTSGRDLPIPGSNEVVPANAIVAYAVADNLLNPNLYSNPLEWDPARYLPDRAEDKKAPSFGFIGWGAGRHPCAGMRFAKLEQNIITAFFVASFEFHLEDANGNKLDKAPSIDHEKSNTSKPDIHPLLRVSPRAE